jgi:hypothetical protein
MQNRRPQDDRRVLVVDGFEHREATTGIPSRIATHVHAGVARTARTARTSTARLKSESRARPTGESSKKG